MKFHFDLRRLSVPVAIGLASAIALSTGGCGGKASLRVETVFYPAPPLAPRVQFLTRYQNGADMGIKVGGFQKFITGQKEQTNALQKPHSAVYHDGKLYVCDSRRGEVVIMDLKKKKISSLGAGESFSFGKPLSIAIADDGYKYVADNFKRRVYVFDENDRYSRSFGKDGQFGPTSVAVFANKLYVADILDNEVEVLDRFTGEVIASTIGSKESISNEFRMPVNIAVDYSGNLYVSDLLAGNIQVFDTSLSFLRNIGELGDQVAQFARPRGVAVDSAGYIYVADAAFENVQVFTPEGELALFFGGPSVQPGGLYLPSGVTICYDDLDLFSQFVDERFDMKYAIIVANQYGPNGISIYGFGDGKEGYFDEIPPAPKDTLQQLDSGQDELPDN